MKVAVTDACIFIDLLDSEVCTAFFQLQFDIVTTRQVWLELEPGQRDELEMWVDSGQLNIVSGISNVIDVRDENNLFNPLFSPRNFLFSKAKIKWPRKLTLVS